MPSEHAATRIGDLEIRSSERFDEFLALEGEWDALWDRAEAAIPMNSHALYRAWWGAYGAGERCLMATARDGDGRLVAAAMFLRRSRGSRALPIRVLRAFGPRNTGSRNGILHLPGRVDAAVALVRALRRTSRAHAVVVGRIDSRWEQFSALCRELRGRTVHPNRSVASIRIEGDYESFFASRSSKFRQNVRQSEARMRRDGRFSVEVHRGAAVDEGMLERMVGIERESWKGESTIGVAAPERIEFFRRFIPAASAKGWSRLYLLRHGDEDVAFNYLLDTRSLVTGYKMSFRPEQRKVSPGAVLLQRAIEDSFRAGFSEIDFFDPPGSYWQSHWASSRLPLAEVIVYDRAGIGGAVWLGRRAWQLVRPEPEPETE